MSDTEQTAVRGGGIRLPLWLIRPVINELPQGESKLGVVGYQIGADTSEIEKCSTLHLRILMVLALADPAPAVCLGIAYCYRPPGSLPQQSSSRALPCPEVRREVRRRSRSSRERRRAASAVPPPLEGRRVGEGLSSGGGGIRVAWGRSGVDGATVSPLNRLGRGRLPLGSRRGGGQPATRRERLAEG